MSQDILKPVYTAVKNIWLSRRLPWVLWGLWAITRISHLVAISTTPVVKILTVDSLHYHETAKQILESGWIPGLSFMNPGYPFFVSIVYWLLTPNPFTVMFLQTALEGLALVLTLAIGRRLLSESAVRIAMLLWVGYAPLVYFNGTLLTTIPILLANVAAAYFLITAFEYNKVWRAALAGACFAASILFRPIPLLYLILLVPTAFWLGKKQLGFQWKHIFITITTALLFLLPVAYHNYNTSGHFVLTQTSGGVVFWIGNHENASGLYDEPEFLSSAEPEAEERDYRLEASRRAGKELDQAATSRYWTNEAIHFLIGNPVEAIRLYWDKFLYFGNKAEFPTNISLYGVEGYSKTLRLLPFGWGAIFAFLLLGLWAIRSDLRRWWIILPFFATYVIANLAFYTASEYRFPLVPWLCLLAGAGIAWIMQKLVEKNADRVMLGIMLIVPAFLWSQYNNRFIVSLKSPRNDNFNWAQMSIRADDPYQALLFFQRTLAIDPFYYEGHYELAMLYYELGFEELAQLEFARIGLTMPEWEGIGNGATPDSTNFTKDATALEATYRKLIADSPPQKRIRIQLKLGALLQKQQRYDEAIAVLQTAEVADSVSAESTLRIAQIYHEQSKLEQALTKVDEVLNLEVDNVLANLLKYDILKKLHRDTDAEKQLALMDQRSNNDPNWRHLLESRLHTPNQFVTVPDLKQHFPQQRDSTSGNW